MSFSALPLGYCTNVHPGRSVADVLAGLDHYTVPVMRSIGRPIATGLWFARPVVDELLADPDGLARFAEELASRNLTCYTLNAFPYGDFHAARVKENVYLPDWSQPERLTYTAECAAALAALLPAGTDGSISTLPLGFKGFEHPAGFTEKCIRNLIECAVWFDRVQRETGRTVRLAIEPEPFCPTRNHGGGGRVLRVALESSRHERRTRSAVHRALLRRVPPGRRVREHRGFSEFARSRRRGGSTRRRSAARFNSINLAATAMGSKHFADMSNLATCTRPSPGRPTAPSQRPSI